MSTTATVTGVAGPGQAVTAQVFLNVANFKFYTNGSEILELEFSDGRATLQISIAAATTITCTVSGSNYVLTVS